MSPERPSAAQHPESLAVRIETEIRDGKLALPVLPRIAMRVQTLIEEDAGTSAIVEAIEREPSIAAALMRYANSVAFAGYAQVTELRQAVMRLGYTPVQQTVLALSLRSVFRTTDGLHVDLYRAIWSHSVTAALGARRLAARASMPAETAFLAGLLHDIGKVVILECMSVLRRREPDLTADDAMLREVLTALHCRAGELLCVAWNIPAELRDVVQRHHDMDVPPTDRLLSIVQLADMIAKKIVAGPEPETDPALLEAPASVMLGLDEPKMANLLEDLKDDCRSIAKLF